MVMAEEDQYQICMQIEDGFLVVPEVEPDVQAA